MPTSHLIAEQWPLDNITLGETFQSYPTRSVVRIHAAQGEFVAKVDRHPPAYEAACQPYALFDFLAERAFPHIPALLKTRDGQPLLYCDDQSIAIMEYIDGGQPDNSPAMWEALGKVVANLNAVTDCPVPYAIPTAGAIAELTEDAQAHSHPKQFRDFIAMLSPLLVAPTLGLVHGEINRANVRQRRDGSLVIIDWDEAGHGPTVLDVGYPLITVFLTEKLHFYRRQAQAFYRGYFGGRRPDAAEQDLLFRAALLHALRYMRFANQAQRWRRICYAVTHRPQIFSAVFNKSRRP
jgi:Ser/Thr protein kinase RdoA (MazF antagonist)